MWERLTIALAFLLHFAGVLLCRWLTRRAFSHCWDCSIGEENKQEPATLKKKKKSCLCYSRVGLIPVTNCLHRECKMETDAGGNAIYMTWVTGKENRQLPTHGWRSSSSEQNFTSELGNELYIYSINLPNLNFACPAASSEAHSSTLSALRTFAVH